MKKAKKPGLKNCNIGANCKNTCIDQGKNCLVASSVPVIKAVAKLKGTEPLPKGIKSISWGRMQLVHSGHEKLIKAADLSLLSKATSSHIKKLGELFPGNKFETTDKGLFQYLSRFNEPLPVLILGSDNKALGDNVLKYDLVKKVKYIDRPANSKSSSEARVLFRGGKSPEEMVKDGYFKTLDQAIYGQQIALDLA